MLNLRNHRALLSTLGTLLIASTSSGIAWSFNTHEPADVLLDAVRHSETGMRGYIDEIGGRFDEIEATSDTTRKAELATALMRDVPELAQEARTGVITAKEEAKAVFLPDNGQLDQARDAYVTHIDAWIAEYDQAIVTPSDVMDIDPQVNQTYNEAAAAFDQLDLEPEQQERVERILAE